MNADQQQVVRCDQCGKVGPLSAFVQVETIQRGKVTVQASWVVCPACGFKRLAHVMTPELEAERGKLNATAARFQRLRTQEAWVLYMEARTTFARHFDEVQKHWRRKLGIQKKEPVKG